MFSNHGIPFFCRVEPDHQERELMKPQAETDGRWLSPIGSRIEDGRELSWVGAEDGRNLS